MRTVKYLGVKVSKGPRGPRDHQRAKGPWAKGLRGQVIKGQWSEALTKQKTAHHSGKLSRVASRVLNSRSLYIIGQSPKGPHGGGVDMHMWPQRYGGPIVFSLRMPLGPLRHTLFRGLINR